MLDFLAFSFTEFSGDMIFVLKIFMFLTIVSFVWQHLGKGPISVLVIAGLAYVMLISPFAWFFSVTYVLMTLLMLGIGGIIIDFVFAFPGMGAGMESQVGSQKDLMDRSNKFQKGRQQMHPPRPRVPPPV